MRCDAHQAEQATTIIILESGNHLTLCGHHTRHALASLDKTGHQYAAHELHPAT